MYEQYAQYCLVPSSTGHALFFATKVVITGNPAIENIKTSKSESLTDQAKAISKILGEATGYSLEKPGAMRCDVLQRAYFSMHGIAVNMAAEVKIGLDQQRAILAEEQQNQDAAAFITRAEPLHRVLVHMAGEIMHLIRIADFLVATSAVLPTKYASKVQAELLVVTKRLRTRLFNSSSGNWIIVQTIDPHARNISSDSVELARAYREAYDEVERNAPTSARKAAVLSTLVEPNSDEETPETQMSKKPKSASAGAIAAAPPKSAAAAQDLVQRKLSIQATVQLASVKAENGGTFKGLMFDLCPSSTRDTPCLAPPGKCRFWHLCASCLKSGIELADCLDRRHFQHLEHKK